eukprot:CAMPEP_0118971776 /NCGR_PEP_ID=MMETSP1173-20130426/8309_1 /TAXON_ID=1034831 /ORGANISM="Rhizochromulina marina cf, Strain CCMP1243" /LENGTH=176 /DNA_ID=CAMNT_0006921265 /DNA_START=81 /DNA_END=611 /DNA_ORIENTATION=+
MSGSSQQPPELSGEEQQQRGHISELGLDASDSMFVSHQRSLKKRRVNEQSAKEAAELERFRAASASAGGAATALAVPAKVRDPVAAALVPKLKRRKAGGKGAARPAVGKGGDGSGGVVKGSAGDAEVKARGAEQQQQQEEQNGEGKDQTPAEKEDDSSGAGGAGGLVGYSSSDGDE